MSLETHHYVIMALLGLVLVYAMPLVGGEPSNELKNNKIVEAAWRIQMDKYWSIVLCDGVEFQSVGFPTNGIPCKTDQDCKDNWPAGPSYQIRDRSMCCVSLGECGETAEQYKEVTHTT